MQLLNYRFDKNGDAGRASFVYFQNFYLFVYSQNFCLFVCLLLGLTKMVMLDAHRSFVSCFHAFYPTGYLKWACLCNLLASMEANPSSGMCNIVRLVMEFLTWGYKISLVSSIKFMCLKEIAAFALGSSNCQITFINPKLNF